MTKKKPDLKLSPEQLQRYARIATEISKVLTKENLHFLEIYSILHMVQQCFENIDRHRMELQMQHELAQKAIQEYTG